jgi:hypothetical protein
MTLVDDIETKKEAQFLLCAAALTGFLASTSYCRPWLPDLALKPFSDKALVDQQTSGFFFVSTGILVLLSLCLRLSRRRLLLTEEGVHHLPKIAYRSSDFRWQDVASWGSRTDLQGPDSEHEGPITSFYVKLKNEKLIEEPTFFAYPLAVSLEKHVGPRIDIVVDSLH